MSITSGARMNVEKSQFSQNFHGVIWPQAGDGCVCLWLFSALIDGGQPAYWQLYPYISVEALLLRCHLDVQCFL